MGPQIPQRLTDQTAERLLHMIGSDPAYRPGAKLPNEPRLCELFGVSRTTLREAVRSLAAQGYVEVRRGSGTFVLDRASAPDIGLQRLESLRTRLRDLFEIRMMIEPQAARLACLRGTDEELREIAHRAQCVARAIREGENFTQPEEAFHQAFVAATHNPFMEQLRPGDEVAFAGAMLMCMGIGMVLSVACYVLEALSLYTIAQRRGIRKPWLAWIPVVNVWIVGSISDQYQYVVNRRIQNRRKVLLGLAIACGVTFLGYTVCLLGVAGRALMNEADGLMVAWLLFAMLFVLAAFAIVVTYTVFAFISLYYVYKSCNPDTAVVFLVLSIVIPVTMPFFLLADRNLDRGMPPRRQEPQPLPETAQNVEPTGKEPAEASPEEPEGTSQEL